MTRARLRVLGTCAILAISACGEAREGAEPVESLTVEVVSVEGFELGVRVSREQQEAGRLLVSLGVGQGAEVAGEAGHGRSEGWLEVGGEADFVLRLAYAFGDVRVWARGNDVALARDDGDGAGHSERAFGISEAVAFEVPRVADVQGFAPQSPYANAHLELMSAPPADLVVTSLDRWGFYVTDVTEGRGYGSLYVRAWPSETLVPGARLTRLFGRINEFYGLTELDSADYSLDTSRLPAKVPSAIQLGSRDFDHLERFEAALVEVRDVRVAAWFGANLATGGAFGPGRSNCDFDHNGEIDWDNGRGAEDGVVAAPQGHSILDHPVLATGTSQVSEAECVVLCAEEPECTEWTQYSRYKTFKVSTASGEALAVGTTRAPDFSAPRFAGTTLARVRGNLRHFAPGSPGFSIAVRSSDDLRAASQRAAETLPVADSHLHESEGGEP